MIDRPAAWSALHHGIDPAEVPLVAAWLRVTWWLAGPLARWRTPPLALTVVGAGCALAAVPVAGADAWLALVLVVAAVISDALDGAVAILRERATRAGAGADAVADRVADCAFAAVIWRCGAPWWLALAAGAISLAHEGFRQLRGGALRSRITVAERPSRAVCTGLACISAGISPAAWPPTVCAAVWCGLGMVGLAQLASTARVRAAMR